MGVLVEVGILVAVGVLIAMGVLVVVGVPYCGIGCNGGGGCSYRA